jgi:hypothetical protein
VLVAGKRGLRRGCRLVERVLGHVEALRQRGVGSAPSEQRGLHAPADEARERGGNRFVSDLHAMERWCSRSGKKWAPT